MILPKTWNLTSVAIISKLRKTCKVLTPDRTKWIALYHFKSQVWPIIWWTKECHQYHSSKYRWSTPKSTTMIEIALTIFSITNRKYCNCKKWKQLINLWATIWLNPMECSSVANTQWLKRKIRPKPNSRYLIQMLNMSRIFITRKYTHSRTKSWKRKKCNHH